MYSGDLTIGGVIEPCPVSSEASAVEARSILTAGKGGATKGEREGGGEGDERKEEEVRYVQL